MGDRFLNDFTEFIQKPVPMISPNAWPDDGILQYS